MSGPFHAIDHAKAATSELKFAAELSTSVQVPRAIYHAEVAQAEAMIAIVEELDEIRLALVEIVKMTKAAVAD